MLIRCLLIGFSFFVLFASIVTLILRQRPLSVYSSYFLLMISLAAVLSLKSWSEISKENLILNKNEFSRFCWAMACAATGWWVYRRPFWFRFPMWFDEATQFIPYWSLDAPVSRSIYAAMQQQPPLPYYLSDFSLRTTGATYESALYLSIIFGVLSLLVFTLWLVQIQFSKLWLAVPVAVFCSQSTLLRYNFEARPVSITVFLGLMVLFFTYESIQNKKISVFSLFSSSFLLLHSSSLQPLFFLFFMVLCFTPFFVAKKEWKNVGYFIATVFVAPIILFLPNIFIIYRESVKHSQFYSSHHVLDFWNGLFQINMHSFAIFTEAFDGIKPWMALLFVFIAGLCLFDSYREKRLQLNGKIIWVCVFFIFGFPILFRAFWSIINWVLNPHYFVLWTAGSIALFCYGFTHIYNLGKTFRNRIYGQVLMSFLFVCILINIHKVYATTQATDASEGREYYHNWPEIFSAASSENKSLFITLPYSSPNDHDYYGHFTGVLYSNEKQLVWSPSIHNIYNMTPKKIRTDMQNFLQPERIYNFEKGADLYFIFNFQIDPQHTKEKEIIEFLNRSSSARIPLSKGREMFKIYGGASSSETIRSLILGLVKIDPTSTWNSKLLITYINEALNANAYKMAAQMFKELKKVKTNSQDNGGEVNKEIDKIEDRLRRHGTQ